MPFYIHLLSEPEAEAPGQLATLLDPEIHVAYGDDPAALARCQVLVAGRPSREQLAASPHLRALVIPWAGLPPETRALLKDFPHLAVHNLHHNAAATAETAFALLLAAAKFVAPMDRALRANDWRPRYAPNPSVLLEGRTALVLGYGAIGRRVAVMCRGLQMNVLATQRSLTRVESDSAAEVHPPADLHALLPRADALIICLPLTDETVGLIGAHELNLLPSRAVLVNVGRGAIVDEAALFNALKTRRLHAAGIDVWYNYPKNEAEHSNTPPSRFPFGELDNVALSPHRAGDLGGPDTELARMEALARVLNALARDEEAENRVDVGRGY